MGRLLSIRSDSDLSRDNRYGVNPRLRSAGCNSPGRPVSSRQRIAESLLKDIGSLWDRRRPEILEWLADEEPAKIAAIAYGILPKEAFVKIENQLDPRLKTLQNMDADALAALGGPINAIKEAKADGCEPGTVFAWVEEDLRARMAVPVEKSLDRAGDNERHAANNRNGDERASR